MTFALVMAAVMNFVLSLAYTTGKRDLSSMMIELFRSLREQDMEGVVSHEQRQKYSGRDGAGGQGNPWMGSESGSYIVLGNDHGCLPAPTRG